MGYTGADQTHPWLGEYFAIEQGGAVLHGDCISGAQLDLTAHDAISGRDRHEGV